MSKFVIVRDSDQATTEVDVKDQAAAEALAENLLEYAPATYAVHTFADWGRLPATILQVSEGKEYNRSTLVKQFVMVAIHNSTLPPAIYNALIAQDKLDLDNYHIALWALKDALDEPDVLVLPVQPLFL